MAKLTEYQKCIRRAARCINSALLMHPCTNDTLYSVMLEVVKQRNSPNVMLSDTIQFLKENPRNA